MPTVKATSKIGTVSVRKLREQKLRNGLPFMINVKELSTDQCYLEFPDGSIKLMAVTHATTNMNVIRELTTAEASELRGRFHFLPLGA
jgi:hypothetical protein